MDESVETDLDAGRQAWEAGDFDLAEFWWRKAWTSGDPRAAFNLGLLAGVRGKWEEAEAFYRSAATADHPVAREAEENLLWVLRKRELL